MKTRRSLCSFVISLMLLSVLFYGAATAAAVIVQGPASCGQWVQNRGSDGMPDTHYKFWLLGYMSGMAVASRIDILKDIDASSIELWMDNYCMANPLNGIDDGGADLFRELERKMKRK